MNVKEAKVFVEAWQNAGSVQEVADKLKMPKEKVVATSRALRKKGIELKMYGRSTVPLTQLEIEELQEYLQVLTGKKG